MAIDMHLGYFITGTDTNVGKTWATLALLHYFRNQGKSVVGMKPVASGSYYRDGLLKNEDALQVQAHSSVQATYELINPYAFEAPVSPHIAAKDDQVKLNKVVACFKQLQAMADIVVVEGAGGWLTPVNDQEDNCDLARALSLPVIMVVAIRLGCINHAKLTGRVIHQAGIECAGWIAMCPDPAMLSLEETIQTIKNAVATPLLGILPYRKSPDFNFFAQQLRL